MKPLLLALTLSTATATTAMLAPQTAEAGSGSVAIQLNARNADEAMALRFGLALYAMHQDVRSNGHVSQNGAHNAAGILQSGRGSQAIVHQEGDGHRGSVTQRGNNHAHGLFQFGRNTDAHVEQHGHGETGVTIVYGW